MPTYNQSPISNVITDASGVNKAIVDGTGALKTTATFSGSISIGNVTIQDGNGNGPVTVIATGAGKWAMASAIVDASGNQLGIAAAPIRIDPTGTTVQPISWSGAPTVTIQSNASVNLTQVAGSAVSLGQKAMAASIPVVISSDQSAIPITGSITATNPSVSATGAPFPADATFVGASDGTNLVALKVDGSANLKVTQQGTVTVTGTVSATQGTSPWVVSLASTTITGTVAVTQSGTWNIATVTAVTAITNALPAGTNVIGHVITDTGSTTAVTGTVTVSGTVTANIGTTNGLALDATVSALQVAQGSTTSGQSGSLTQGAVTTAAPTYTTAKTNPLSLQTDGSLRTAVTNTVTVTGTVTASNPSVSATGAVVPADATFVGASDGTNLQPLLVDGSGFLKVAQQGSVTVTGTVSATQGTSPWVVSLASTTITGTVAATQSGTWSVRNQDGSGNAITSTGNALDVNLKTSSITLPVSLTSTTITGTVAVTQSTSPWVVAGAAASGAAKSGNPVQIGGVFNTTQPTVTTGQAVELQATARGAQIVATGADTFNVTVNAALPAGTNVIGHVITDSGSTTAVTGTVTVVGPTSSTATAPAATTVTSTSGSILATNANRKEVTVVNTGTVVVFLAFGQTPTSSAYHVALAACSSGNDGTGGTYTSDMWKGAINAIVASTSGTVCVTELT